MIQIYGRKKCSATRKAQRYFSERGIPVQNVNLDQKAPGRRELELFLQIAGADGLIDTECRAFRDRGLVHMEYDPIEELVETPALLRTPVVRSGRKIVIGADEDGWRAVAEGESR